MTPQVLCGGRFEANLLDSWSTDLKLFEVLVQGVRMKGRRMFPPVRALRWNDVSVILCSVYACSQLGEPVKYKFIF